MQGGARTGLWLIQMEGRRSKYAPHGIRISSLTISVDIALNELVVDVCKLSCFIQISNDVITIFGLEAYKLVNDAQVSLQMRKRGRAFFGYVPVAFIFTLSCCCFS